MVQRLPSMETIGYPVLGLLILVLLKLWWSVYGSEYPAYSTTDTNRATMIRSSIWGNTVNLNVTAVPNGSYHVYVYVWEDNFTQAYSISLEGSVVLPVYNSGTGGTWSKLGPFRPILRTEPSMYQPIGGHACFSGIEVWTAVHRRPTSRRLLLMPIADQNATAGLPFSYAFPANTFSDPNAGTTLTYTATLEGGGALTGLADLYGIYTNI